MGNLVNEWKGVFIPISGYRKFYLGNVRIL